MERLLLVVNLNKFAIIESKYIIVYICCVQILSMKQQFSDFELNGYHTPVLYQHE